jgi:hypothetical protein
VPDAAHRKVVWANLGAPGALLSGVDVVGVWRPRRRGRRLGVALELFRPLTGAERAALEAEARRLATARGTDPDGVEITG